MRPHTAFWHLLACSRGKFTRWTRFRGPFRVLKRLGLPSRSENTHGEPARDSSPMVGNQSLAVLHSLLFTKTWQRCFVVIFRKNNKPRLFVCLKTKRTCCVETRLFWVRGKPTPQEGFGQGGSFSAMPAWSPQYNRWVRCLQNTSFVASRHFKTRNGPQKRVQREKLTLEQSNSAQTLSGVAYVDNSTFGENATVR